MPQRAKPSGPSMDAELTARTLEEAALELIERDGVLSGLNLREVADLAGVNRGLVYHYFGSRRDLLRSALRRNARERSTHIRIRDRATPFGERVRQVLKGSIRHSSSVRLAALLQLDGDTRIRMMPERDRTQDVLRRDQEEGAVAAGADTVAMHAVMVALAQGYVLTRNRLAKEFGVGVRELDERVTDLVAHALSGLDGPSAARAGASGAAPGDGPARETAPAARP
ncbi:MULTISPECIES: TetR/AcrR family transcriptional regulator [Actinomadura]|uniref:TetR/AcrR family transcriptional regulator n=1 Tax=Actinomadura yumaensis TaxID=111807 RepID=A0ABW2CAV5_9ACTN|nr:TetR/AcrR family transcriptional regulator [Actinomadura sp. J1-007]